MRRWLTRFFTTFRVKPRFEIVRVSRRWYWVVDNETLETIPAGVGVWKAYTRPKVIDARGDLEALKAKYADHIVIDNGSQWGNY